jgi:hypothetical protein
MVFDFTAKARRTQRGAKPTGDRCLHKYGRGQAAGCVSLLGLAFQSLCSLRAFAFFASLR